MINCLGGWCNKRQHCARHVYPAGGEPAERLCPPGQTMHYRPVLMVANHARPGVESKPAIKH